MSSILVINAAGRETRVALVESGHIAEFYLERKKDQGVVGNIYKGRVVRVRDLGEVKWSEGEWGHVGRFDGKRAVFVTANMKSGYNVLEVRAAVIAAVERWSVGLPKRIALELAFDQSRNVETRLDRLYLDFGIAIAVVLLTLLPLGLRAASIVMISIPLSLAFGISVLYFFGFSLNQLSIAGFVVALGLLVGEQAFLLQVAHRHHQFAFGQQQPLFLALQRGDVGAD